VNVNTVLHTHCYDTQINFIASSAHCCRRADAAVTARHAMGKEEEREIYTQRINNNQHQCVEWKPFNVSLLTDNLFAISVFVCLSFPHMHQLAMHVLDFCAVFTFRIGNVCKLNFS
jgi:hypothetical protein